MAPRLSVRGHAAEALLRLAFPATVLQAMWWLPPVLTEPAGGVSSGPPLPDQQSALSAGLERLHPYRGRRPRCAAGVPPGCVPVIEADRGHQVQPSEGHPAPAGFRLTRPGSTDSARLLQTSAAAPVLGGASRWAVEALPTQPVRG